MVCVLITSIVISHFIIFDFTSTLKLKFRQPISPFLLFAVNFMWLEFLVLFLCCFCCGSRLSFPPQALKINKDYLAHALSHFD